MDQLIFTSLSHTHYWYEVGILKVPAVQVDWIVWSEFLPTFKLVVVVIWFDGTILSYIITTLLTM